MSRVAVCLTASLFVGSMGLISPSPAMAQGACESSCYSTYNSCISSCQLGCSNPTYHEKAYIPEETCDYPSPFCSEDCSTQLDWCLAGCTPSVRTGMTWTVLGQQNGYVHVGADAQTNPYSGDTTIDQSLSILCVLVDGQAAPDGMIFDYYNGWVRGAVKATPPIPGTVLTSQQQGDEICADTFGTAWHLAEFHDGRYGSDFSTSGGWTFWAAGQLAPGTRLWTAINDQPANPWNSAGEVPTTVAVPKFFSADEPVPNQYLAMLPDSTPEANVESLADSLLASYGGSKMYTYPILRGFAFTGTDAQAQAMSQDSRVESVEQDSYGQPEWHLDRIDQRFRPLDNQIYSPRNGNDGRGVRIYVPDTGVRPTHTEFGTRTAAGWDYIKFSGFPFGGVAGVYEDCRGHGTAAASIAAGRTVGVAPGATVVPIRVVGCNGNAYNPWTSLFRSTMVKGVEYAILDHVRNPGPGVVVVSYTFSPGFWRRWTGWRTPVEVAIDAAISNGLTVVVSAGNEGKKASRRSPARLASAITVSATDSTDTRPSWANYGKVDMFAPGVNLIAAGRSSDTEYTSVSGSSFAAPAVAGAAALFLQDHPAASPSEVRNALQSSATPGVVSNPGSGSANRLLYVGPVPVAPSTWTIWLNRDDPSGTGDWEQVSDFRAEGQSICNGATPIGIECRTLGGVNWTNTGETYTCNTSVGGVCQNAQQPDGSCQDYQVRFLCP